MTVDQFIADLDELVDDLCRRIGQARVAIFGHSLGSALGAIYAARFPEKVSVYVGAARLATRRRRDLLVFLRARRSRSARQRKALKELRAIGLRRHTPTAVFVERTAVNRLEGR